MTIRQLVILGVAAVLGSACTPTRYSRSIQLGVAGSNPETWEFDNEKRIVRALEARGYTVVRDFSANHDAPFVARRPAGDEWDEVTITRAWIRLDEERYDLRYVVHVVRIGADGVARAAPGPARADADSVLAALSTVRR